jgi:hypothetical protein
VLAAAGVTYHFVVSVYARFVRTQFFSCALP